MVMFFSKLYNWLDFVLGLNLHADQLALWQMVLRSFIVYFVGIFIVVNTKRFATFQTSLDLVIRIIIGTLLATALVGNIAFFNTLALALMSVCLYWFLAMATYYFPGFERLIKGSKEILVSDGKIQWRAMRRNFMSKSDLMDALHSKTNLEDIQDIKVAYFEKNGEITITPKESA